MDNTTTKEKEQTTLRLPAELKEIMSLEACKCGISMNALLISILRRFLHIGHHELSHNPLSHVLENLQFESSLNGDSI